MGTFMAKTENEDNFEKYKERLNAFQTRRGDLTPSPELPLDKLMDYLVKEGNKLLAAEKKTIKPKDESAKLNKTLALSSTNPYVRARIMILEKMPALRRNEIAEMEKTGNINNSHYEEFVHEVRKLGDSLEK